MPTTIPDCRPPDAVAEDLGALQGWVVCVGVARVVEVEAALEEEDRLLRPIHTDRVQPRGRGHRLRLAGEESTVRGHPHTRVADPGHPHHPRVEEAGDDTRRTMNAVAARVAIVMGVAIVAAEAGPEIAGLTADQPSVGQVVRTLCTFFEIGAESKLPESAH